jgi:hypothetical protein
MDIYKAPIRLPNIKPTTPFDKTLIKDICLPYFNSFFIFESPIEHPRIAEIKKPKKLLK